VYCKKKKQTIHSLKFYFSRKVGTRTKDHTNRNVPNQKKNS